MKPEVHELDDNHVVLMWPDNWLAVDVIAVLKEDNRPQWRQHPTAITVEDDTGRST